MHHSTEFKVKSQRIESEKAAPQYARKSPRQERRPGRSSSKDYFLLALNF
jgi:hypothetical protein